MLNYSKKRNDENDIDVQFTSEPSHNYTAEYPDPTIKSYYEDLKNRTIWLANNVDAGVLEISSYIIRWNMEDRNIPIEDRKPIRIFIYSLGGELETCFSLVDTMLLSKTPIYTYNMGLACSAAGLIFLAGSRRFCTPHSTLLIHSGSGGASGTYEQTEAAMKDYKHCVEYMRKYILERTTLDQATFKKKQSADWYIYSDEQIKYCMATDLIEDMNQIIGEV